MVTELSKNKTNIYSSLSNSKMRNKYGLFQVEGFKSVKDTLSSFELESIIYIKGKRPDFVDDNMTLHEVPQNIMQKLSSLSTIPDVMAIYRLPEDMTYEFKNLPQKLYLAVDGIQDPGNLGTIIRTCHWFGIDNIFASKNTVDVFNPKTIQATMGSISNVKVNYCDLHELFDFNCDLPVYGLTLEGKNIFKSELKSFGFILMGNEGHGISRDLYNKITDPLLIPPMCNNHSESLNVAVATGITLSQFAEKIINNGLC